VDLQRELARGAHLREQLLRQAVRHGVADGLAGVTRLQIVDEVYDEQYWEQYRAGLAGLRESEHADRSATPVAPARPPAPSQSGQAHPDDAQAAHGWQVGDHGVYTRAAAPAAETQPDAPFAVRLLGELEASGEWNPPASPTVTHDRHSEVMGVLDRQWMAPGIGLDRDGPEAG
jgi:hypothetical protein